MKYLFDKNMLSIPTGKPGQYLLYCVNCSHQNFDNEKVKCIKCRDVKFYWADLDVEWN